MIDYLVGGYALSDRRQVLRQQGGVSFHFIHFLYAAPPNHLNRLRQA